jgi:hypothetical protein
MTTETKSLASEACHYYGLDGSPKYSVIGKNGNERPTTIKDARQNSWVPSVSTVLQAIAKPGLEAWKARQLLEASLTLPRNKGESLDDYAKRVIEDAKAQGVAAAERGTELHAAIEDVIRTGVPWPQWEKHLGNIWDTLQQHGINLVDGEPEHSFATSINGMGFGGKVDYHFKDGECCLIDFKSKDKIEDGKRLAWDEHVIQLGAYGFGLFQVVTSGNRPWKWQPFRGLNVFVGVSDCQVRVVEHEPADLERGFELFQCVLEFWCRSKKFGIYAE